MTTIYPRVRVTGAPGYGEFDGEMITETDAVDSRGPLAVIASVWEGEEDIAVVPRSCVQVTRRVVAMEDDGVTLRVMLPSGVGYVDIEPGRGGTLANRPVVAVDVVSTTIDTPAQDGRLYEVESSNVHHRLWLTGYSPTEEKEEA